MGKKNSDFNEWWHAVGSGIAPEKNEDAEEHARRVAIEAWIAGRISLIEDEDD